jgi:hypothetical protein
MMSRKFLLLGTALLVLLIGFGAIYWRSSRPRKLTFAECEKSGGTAWVVDIYHPEICPACVEYQACAAKYDYSQENCPQLIPCSECMQDQFPYPDKCPGGKEKIGEISDAAIWFLCCK